MKALLIILIAFTSCTSLQKLPMTPKYPYAYQVVGTDSSGHVFVKLIKCPECKTSPDAGDTLMNVGHVVRQ